MNEHTQTPVEDPFANIRSFELMVPIQYFPEGEREFDLSKGEDVLKALLDIIRRELPTIEDCYLWIDRSDYATHGTRVVGFTDFTPEQEGGMCAFLEEALMYKWLPEAFDVAGVVFDDDTGEHEGDPNVVFDAIIHDLGRVIEDVQNGDTADTVAHLEAIARAVISLQESWNDLDID